MTWVYNITNPNAPTDAAQIIAVAVVMTGLALLIVASRIYVRWGILNVFGIDDGLVIFSWFMSFGFTTITSLQTRYGLGLQNIDDMPAANFEEFSKMQDRKKVVILGLFGLGIFITIIQIIRIQTVRRLANLTDSAPLITWSSVEANLGIIVASIPCLSPLVKYFRERVTTASRSRRKSGTAGYRIGSHYALHNWDAHQDGSKRSKREDLGIETIAEGRSGTRGSVSTAEDVESAGIVRKTEITITRE
ncbi:hypothetical protein N0V82_000599 [Gnomoniopsis sp. IMI 355080]|nr:hypothetical protein N0V82_000599 [Gnomoniopsis sp. IMI 355080]